MANDRKVLRYKCRVRGVFGRNRKVKSDSWPIAEDADPDEPREVSALMGAFRAKLAEVRFRGGHASIVEEPITLSETEIDGRVFKSESYMLFSSRTLHEERVEGAGVVFG